MKRMTALVAAAFLAVASGGASAQNAAMSAMPMNTLFVAQLDGAHVVGKSASLAVATGAFLLAPRHHSLSYHLTYQGLEAGGPRSIALYHFGAGGNGRQIEILCGAGPQRCPSGAAATIVGALGNDRGALDNTMIGEFDSGRVYVEIVGGDGKPEIRGQLGANPAMVRVANFVAQLAPVRGSSSHGSGTAVVSETLLPGGKIGVFYALTIAGTSGVPMQAAFVRNLAHSVARVAPEMVLPRAEVRASRDRTGGALTGAYDVDAAGSKAPFASRIIRDGRTTVGLVVSTARFPHGELAGDFLPVR